MAQLGYYLLFFIGIQGLNFFVPLTIPETIVNSIVSVCTSFYSFEGLIPVEALLDSFFFDIMCLMLFSLYNLMTGLIGGQPKLD